MAAAVLRAAGSTRMCALGTCGSTAAVASAMRAPVATHTRSGETSGCRRLTVAAMSGSSARPASGRSCLGRACREAGQKRVPEPPARMTAWT